MNPAQEVIDLLQKLERGIQTLTNVINTTLAKVPDYLGWIVDRLREGWNALIAKLEEFWNWFTDKLTYVGDPFALSGAASSWKVDVAGPAANIVRDVDDSDLRVDDFWEGDGAAQYKQAIPPQREAIGSIQKDFANNIASALESLRTAIIVFWVAVAAGLITIIVAFATATGEAVTVLGIPLAPPTALGGLAVGLGAMGAALWNLTNAASGARSSLQSTAQGVQSWPRFVTA